MSQLLFNPNFNFALGGWTSYSDGAGHTFGIENGGQFANKLRYYNPSPNGNNFHNVASTVTTLFAGVSYDYQLTVQSTYFDDPGDESSEYVKIILGGEEGAIHNGTGVFTGTIVCGQTGTVWIEAGIDGIGHIIITGLTIVPSAVPPVSSGGLNFPEPDRGNVSGVVGFRFVPVEDVASVAEPDGATISLPILVQGADWNSGYATLETLDFTESPDDLNGSFKWLLKGFYPGDSDDVRALMRRIALKRHFVEFIDSNNIKRLLFSPGRDENGRFIGCKFSAEFSINSKVAGRKGYFFEFSMMSKDRAFIVV